MKFIISQFTPPLKLFQRARSWRELHEDIHFNTFYNVYNTHKIIYIHPSTESSVFVEKVCLSLLFERRGKSFSLPQQSKMFLVKRVSMIVRAGWKLRNARQEQHQQQQSSREWSGGLLHVSCTKDILSDFRRKRRWRSLENIQFIFHFTTKTNNKKMYLKGNFPSPYTYTHMVHVHFLLSSPFLCPLYGLAIKFSSQS